MRWIGLAIATSLSILCGGCPLVSDGDTVNPFLTIAEQRLVESSSDTTSQTSSGGTSGTAATALFRQNLTLTFANNNANADLNFNYIMWVNPSSIRSAGQQDALYEAGYVRLTSELPIGSAFTLAPGTFVHDDEGHAWFTRVSLRAAGGEDADNVTANEASIETITPDAILFFLDPPESCDSVAFEYLDEGDVITGDPLGGSLGIFGGATTTGGFKTLAQVDVYQCDPFKPGLFLRTAGGNRESNEYVEGESVRVDFNPGPTAAGAFATVTFSGTDSEDTTVEP